MELKRQIGLITGILIIVADMIGTGIFMTTGNILGMTGNALTVLILWGIGGIVAVSGSLCYAELASMWPEVGGEYYYLKKMFGFLPAFLTGWISLVVGFSAPVATSSLLLVQYVHKFCQAVPGIYTGMLDGIWAQKVTAALIILFFGMLHIVGVKRGSYVQNFLTVLKIMIVLLLIVLGLSMADWNFASRLTARYSGAEGAGGINIPVTGLALLIIMFAYSGWNGASYIAGEMKDPHKNMPRALLAGTLITAALYILLNVVYLISSPGESLMGKDEVGAIAAQNLFGPGVGGIFSLCIAIVLLSAVSVQMMVGPRVYYAMAKDRLIFSSLKRISPRFETPSLAIAIQMALAMLYVFTGSAMTLVIYMGFALNIFPVFTVIGLMRMRRKNPDLARPYRVPLYPVVPLVYITMSVVMMAAALMNWTTTSLFAIGVVVAGVPVYYVWRWISSKTAVSGN